MSNPNSGSNYNREVRQETYRDANGNTHTDVTRTTETDNSYQHGYVHGKAAERSLQENTSAIRDNENASRGLLLGILLTTVVAFAAGTIWYLNQSPQASTTQPVLVPVPSDRPDTESSTVDRSSEKQTIIERIKEVPVPVLQPPASTPQQNENTTTPAPTQPETQAETNQPQQSDSNTSDSSTAESQAPSNSGDFTRPTEGTPGQNKTTTGESSAQ
jgi:hypothetical protein